MFAKLPLLYLTYYLYIHGRDGGIWSFVSHTFAAEPQTPSSFAFSPSFQIPENMHYWHVCQTTSTVSNLLLIHTWSGWGDLNPRPQRPERCALTRLRYIPKYLCIPTLLKSTLIVNNFPLLQLQISSITSAIVFMASSKVSILKKCFLASLTLLVPLKIQLKYFLNSLTALYSPLK